MKTFKKKMRVEKAELSCFICGEVDHFSKDYLECAVCKKKVKNLFIVLSVFQSPCWWIDTGAIVHVCADISKFTSY
jgi:hypothetical protein